MATWLHLVWNLGGGEGPNPAFLLLFHKNHASL